MEDFPCAWREAADPKPLPGRTLEESRPVDELGGGLPGGGKKGLKMVGLPDVVVQESDPVSAGEIEAPVGGLRSCDHPAKERVLGVASPLSQVLESDTRVAEGEDAGRGVIGAGVSDDNDLGPAMGLGESRHQGPTGEKGASVVRRDDDRDKGFPLNGTAFISGSPVGDRSRRPGRPGGI